MMNFCRKAVWGLALMMGLSAQAAVWVEKNQWNQTWEDRFSDWIKSSFTEDIFTKGKYKDISTDCADAVYLSRAIFAYENALPFVILDPTGGATKISNRMSRFDGANESLKFRRFAVYLADMLNTKSLSRDTFPLAITREFVRPGAVWSRPRIKQENFFNMIFGGKVQEDPGHAEVVRDVTETGAIQLIGSTVPSAVRKLISTSSLVFMPIETSTGLRKWMQPDWYGRPQKDLPGFSMEQFNLGRSSRSSNSESDYGSSGGNTGVRNLSEWQQQVQEKLQIRAENKEEALFRYGSNLCNLVQARIDTINQSEARRIKLNGACMNAGDYDSYSTPSRDERIYTTISELVSLGGGFGFTIRGRIDRVEKYLQNCAPVQISANRSLSLFEIAKAYANDQISSDPNDSFAARWGQAAKDESKRCPVY